MAREGSAKIACTSNAFLESEEEWIKQLGIELLKDIFLATIFQEFLKSFVKIDIY